MKYKNILTQIIVGATLLGFIIIAITVFKHAICNNSDIKNVALNYVLSALTGLIGGFVAASFGVEYPSTNNELKRSPKALKLMKLGSYATSSTSKNRQELIGFIFALTYILIGIASVVIWIFINKEEIKSVSNMATTFLGISIPIVAAFLKPSN